jgi:hypothetical protein
MKTFSSYRSAGANSRDVDRLANPANCNSYESGAADPEWIHKYLNRALSVPRLKKQENDMEIKPQAMAIPRETDKLEKGKYGPIYPKTPACYGFSVVAKIIPGREPVFYEYAKKIEAAVAATPNYLAALKLHYLRWLLFPIKGETYFMYQGIFDTEFDKYTEDAVALFMGAGLNTVFENLEGFPKDWKTNPEAFPQAPSACRGLSQISEGECNQRDG